MQILCIYCALTREVSTCANLVQNIAHEISLRNYCAFNAQLVYLVQNTIRPLDQRFSRQTWSITVIPAIPAPLEYSPVLPISKKCCILFNVPLIYDQNHICTSHYQNIWFSVNCGFPWLYSLKIVILVGVKINLIWWTSPTPPLSWPSDLEKALGFHACMIEGNDLNVPWINKKLHLTMRCFLL